MKPVALAKAALLLRPSPVACARQSDVAGKNLSCTDTVVASMSSVKQVPADVSLAALRNAGDQYIADVMTLVALDRQIRIASKLPDVYALMRELTDEWQRYESLYPDAAADGWLGLLVKRANVLRTEIDEIANEART
jgi:hypothetical protein